MYTLLQSINNFIITKEEIIYHVGYEKQDFEMISATLEVPQDQQLLCHTEQSSFNPSHSMI